MSTHTARPGIPYEEFNRLKLGNRVQSGCGNIWRVIKKLPKIKVNWQDCVGFLFKNEKTNEKKEFFFCAGTGIIDKNGNMDADMTDQDARRLS